MKDSIRKYAVIGSIMLAVAATSFYVALFFSYRSRVMKDEAKMDSMSALIDSIYYINREMSSMLVAFDAVVTQIEDKECELKREFGLMSGDELYILCSHGMDSTSYAKMDFSEFTKNKIKDKMSAMAKRIMLQSDSRDSLAALIQRNRKFLSCAPLMCPIPTKYMYGVSSEFGLRIDAIDSSVSFHQGVDISAKEGSDVLAPGDGVVTMVSYSTGGYGNKVVIRHGYGYETLYAHLTCIKVKVGNRVKRGDAIAVVGSTGKSTGVHLHYEVLKHGKNKDPINHFYTYSSKPSKPYRIMILSK